MPKFRPLAKKSTKSAVKARVPRLARSAQPAPKLTPKSRRPSTPIGEIVRKRAEAEAAIAQARKSHERLREAIEILPQGIVFLDAEGRYILWNKKYAEIYSRSSDLFEEGARLQDTIRVGIERGDYPEAIGREEEWIAERLKRLYQPGERHEQTLSDGRVILIEERLTEDGGVIGLRVDITELKQREASFRLLFDSNPVPMIVCALDDERILGVNDAAVAHYGYSRAEFENLTIRSVQAFESEPPWAGDRSSDELTARTWKHVRADGTLIDLAIYSRHLVYNDQPAVLLALEGSVTVQGSGGQRSLSAQELFLDYMETAIAPGEVLTEVRVPALDGWGFGYQKFNRRSEDWAMVAVSAVVRASGGVCEDVRIGLTNMGSVPLRATAAEAALRGKPLDGESIAAAAEQAAEGTDPPADLNASADFKRHLARVLCGRALQEAAAVA